MGSTICTRLARMVAAPAALLLVAAACDYAVGTQPAQLDAGFGGGDGAAVFGGLRTRTADTMTSSVRLPDGRVVALGTTVFSTGVVTRYLADGALDPSFGDDGAAALTIEPIGNVAVAADGAVLVPGRSQQSVWAVERLRPDGTPDPGFGAGGVAVLDVAGASGNNWTIGTAADGDRTYLLAWSRPGTTLDTILLALGPDGTLAPAFGPDGTGILRITGGGDSGAIAVTDDGTVVVSYSNRGSSSTIAGVVRISPAGDILARLDLATAGTPTPIRRIDDMDLAADGSVALAVDDDFGDPTGYALRVTPANGLDAGFGTGGAVSLAGINLVATQALLDTARGRVVLAGTPSRATGGDFVTAALGAGGALDPGWGTGGVAVHAARVNQTTAAGLFATADGVLVAGQTSRSLSDPTDQYLLALTPTGQPDPGFGDEGWVRTDLGAEALEVFAAVATLPGGDLLVAGDTGDGVIAGRYGADGTPDGDHPPATLLPDRLRGPMSVADVAVDGDGAAYVLVRMGDAVLEEFGQGPFGWTLIKLDADGAIDTSYGDGGVVTSATNHGLPLSVAVRPDGTPLLAILDVQPAEIIPPHDFQPAVFSDQLVALSASGAVGDTTTLDSLNGSPGFVPAISTSTLALGPAGDAYVVASGAVRRLAPDGTVSAWAPLPAGATLAPSDLAVDGAGRVVVVGAGNAPGGAAGDVVARFDGTLALDPTFGTGGFVPLTGSGGGNRSATTRTDGTVTIVRQTGVFPSEEVLVDRVLPSGQPDPSYSGDGRSQGTVRVVGDPAIVRAATLAGSDVVLAGYVEAGAYVARING
jgi:uncharacterized delta-60 repeat protein